MRITKIEAFPLRLPFRGVFKIARGTVGDAEHGAPHVYIRVEADDGMVGWGESRPSPRWSYETQATVVASVRDLEPALLGLDPFDIREVHRRMGLELAPGITIGQPVVKCGIDMAIHDLVANALGVPLCRLFGVAEPSDVPLSGLITADSPDQAAETAQRGWEQGYRGFKVKTGIHPETDLEMLQEIKRRVPDAFLWADANQGYTVQQAVRLARGMAAIGVDVLEQPVPAHDVEGLAALVHAGHLPIAVDESFFAVHDLLDLIRRRAADAVVVKLSKMGGLFYSRQAAELATTAGLVLLGSGLTESRLGLAAAAHLMGAVGIRLPVDLNGPQFLEDDPISGGVDVGGGVVRLSGRPGIGVTLDETKLQQYRCQVG